MIQRNFVLKRKATIELPINVADQYSHKSPTEPDNNAGAREQAGFIEAPETSAKSKYLILQCHLLLYH